MTWSVDAATQIIELPDGSVPLFALMIVSYLNDDGEEEYGWATTEGTTVANAIGLMQMVTHGLLHEEGET